MLVKAINQGYLKHERAETMYKPRYVRVNTLKTTVNETVEAFRNEGWILKRFTKTDDYLDFLDVVSNLGSEEFMIDLHIPYLLIFPQKAQFYRHRLYKNGSIILQDKASCLPAHILNPEPGSVVLDMCAAPGMKTTQCAAIMENSGKIYAVEIGTKRFETLKQMVESAGATCVETINADVLTLPVERYKDVEYILVDPSCSGSGITDRVEIGQQEIDQHKNRLDKLASFQITLLRYALIRFPKVKRVVYSTCSVYPEENEDVVRQVLETCFYFKLVPASPFIQNKWQNFGSSYFGELGNHCLYSKPDIDLTSGFFVAVFERLEEGERNPFVNENLFQQKMQRRMNKIKKEDHDEVNEQSKDWEAKGEVLQEVVEVSKIKKEKRKKRDDQSLTDSLTDKTGHEENNDLSEEVVHKKKNASEHKEVPETTVVIDSQNNYCEDQKEILQEVVDVSKSKKEKRNNQGVLMENFASVKVEGTNDDEDLICKKKKQKNRKEKPLTEKLTDKTHGEENDLSEGVVHKKKKKKKKATDEFLMEHSQVPDAEDTNNIDEDVICKMKKKIDGSLTEIVLDKFQIDDEENPALYENVVLKKKKRKKNAVDESSIEHSQVDEVGEDRVHKKKKKKCKDNENGDCVEEQVDNLPTNDTGTDAPTHKKKKKKKDKHLQLDETETTVADEVVVTKKKRNDVHLDEATLEVEDTENDKRRKKRGNNESVEISSYDNDEERKKKKKKKTKSEV